MTEAEPIYKQWHHAPSHLFLPNNTYMVTAGTYQKKAYFNTSDKLDFLQNTLFEEISQFGWSLEAWAIMANHYHFVTQAPDNPDTLKKMITALHSKTAIWLNSVDNTPSRKVWFQYWDSCITYERSYLARLNYVHNNPVRHGLVEDAEQYPWCSFSWFSHNAELDYQRSVFSMPIDRISIRDDF